MPSITYSPKQDLKNWLRIKQRYSEDFYITKSYPFDKNIELSKDNFNCILKTINPAKIKRFRAQAVLIKKEWLKKEDEIIKKITNYLKVPFKKFDFKINLTTVYIMPYDYKDKWFMIPTHKEVDKQIQCIVHELFHLYHLEKDPFLSQEELEEEVRKFYKRH